MKRILTLTLAAVTVLALLASCAQSEPTPSDTSAPATDAPVTDAPATEPPETEPPAPVLVPSGYEITVTEAESILAANGLRTNENREWAYPAYHGGQQMRVVHTERGTYTAFVTDFGTGTGIGVYVVMKVDNGGGVTLLYTGEYRADGGTTPVNIGQDLNGDIVVALGCGEALRTLIFDHETDAMTEHSVPHIFASTEDTRHGDRQIPAYSQVMFDFANRRIYVFYCGGASTGDWLLEWFTYNMETGEWNDVSTYKWIEGVRRHCYLYPFPDGKGGVYIIAERDDTGELEEEYWGNSTWLWDELRLFHIPDLTSPENITWTTIQEAYTERGHDGIWSTATMGHYGCAFMDADGYLHVMYYYGAGNAFEPQYRHAIYNVMECVYNERVSCMKETGVPYKLMLAQKTDGTLYMIAYNKNKSKDNAEIYRAEDPLGKTWKLETVLSTGVDGPTYSMSSTRNGSTQDNVVSGFVYSYKPDTVYIFTISLNDYSCSGPVDVFEGLDLSQDHMLDTRAYHDSHPTKIIRTEEAAYAVFTYNYLYEDVEQFHIVKIGNDGEITILYSGDYTSVQDRYLSMQRMADGKICVFSPDGFEVYLIDPATDEVEETELEKKQNGDRQQTDLLVTDTGDTYVFFHTGTVPYTLTGNKLSPFGDLQKQTNRDTEYVFEEPQNERYDDLYTVYDGRGGAYIVGTRLIGVPDVLHYKSFRDERGYEVVTYPRQDLYSSPMPENLTYNGRTRTIKDSVELFYVPSLGGNAVQCVTVQPPYEDEGGEGIWSVVDVSESGDVYVDAEGKLHVIYALYHFDFDDADRRSDPALIADTLKHIHAVYDGTTLVSSEELEICGVTKQTAAGMMQVIGASRSADYTRRPAIRMAQTADGTMMLLVCHLGEEDTRIDVYFGTEDGWALTAMETVGGFMAEAFNVSSPRGGSVQDDTVDCLIYAMDNDVYHVRISFAGRE